MKIVPGWTVLKNKKFCKDQNQFFFLQGPKLKRGIFAGTSTIFKPYIYILLELLENDKILVFYISYITKFSFVHVFNLVYVVW